MDKITLTLTYDEAIELSNLLESSCQTGNEDWDKTMANIMKKLDKKLNQ